MIRIGEAAHDERGAVAYGQPGDQTGDEVRNIELYNNPNRPWQLVFRAKSDEKRRKIALAMRQAVANDNIGYAQYGDGSTPYRDRYGLYYALQQTPSHTIPDVTIPCNCDCSSLVSQCCRAAGIPTSIYMRTASEINELMNTGEFDKLTFNMNMVFCEGDILWLNGHTAVVIQTTSDTWDKNPKWVAAAKQYCNVYASNSTKSALLSAWPHLGVGNLVDVCDEDTNFYYVRIAAKYWGFVEKKYMTTPQPEPTPAPEPTPEPTPTFEKFEGEVDTALYTRTGPEKGAPYCNFNRNDGKGVRHTLFKGEKVTVIAEKNGWYQLEIKGATATWYPWSSGKYITKLAPRQPQVGDAINFIGKQLYASSYAAGKAVAVPRFSGKIKGVVDNAHPYSVIADNRAYSGWCNREDFDLV